MLSLPRRSLREGRDYEMPPELRCIFEAHPWLEVNWVDRDEGPGTKSLGALEWLQRSAGEFGKEDVLMVLDDDHEYLPWALGELLREQRARKGCSCSFFAYFYRGLMVPQGADIIAFQLDQGFPRALLDFHRDFVAGDAACFLVDDLWLGMFLHLCGREVVSLRDHVVARGLEMVYRRTENSKVEALMSLEGESRRDRATLRAFDGLLARLLAAPEAQLEALGGRGAAERMRRLDAQVRKAERQMADMEAWLQRNEAAAAGPQQKISAQLNQLRHLYRMQGAPP